MISGSESRNSAFDLGPSPSADGEPKTPMHRPGVNLLLDATRQK